MTQRNITTDEFNEAINRAFAEFVKTGVIPPAPEPAEPDAQPAPEPNIEPEIITVQLYRMAFRGNNIGFYGRWGNGPEYEIIIKEVVTDKYKMFVFEEGHRLKYSYWGDIDDIEHAAYFLNIELDFMNTDMLADHKSRYDAERIAALGEL